MEQVIQYGIGLLFGISTVWAFVSKAQILRKYLTLSAQVVLFIDQLIAVTEDRVISADEIKKLAADATAIKEAFKKVRGK